MTSEAASERGEAAPDDRGARAVRFAGREFEATTEVIDEVNVDLGGFGALCDLPNLRVLRVHHTDPHRRPSGLLSSLAPLGRCQRLEALEIPHQPLRSLVGLEQHPALRTLDVRSTAVDDLRPLARVPHLSVLRLRHTRVSDVSPLSSVRSLEELDIAHTLVEDLSPLATLPRLAVLDARGTRVTDLSPLAQLPALRRVVVQRLALEAGAVASLRAARPDLTIVE